MQSFTYDIQSFHYSRCVNAFLAASCTLQPQNSNTSAAFPNGARQFFIKNYRTGNFRRFRLLCSTESKFVFTSFDGITCVIYRV